MTYLPAGYAPQPGDIFVTTVHGGAGFAIAEAERLLEFVQRWHDKVATVYRHAGVYVGNGRVVEAEPGPAGARIADLSEYDSYPVLWLRCPEEFRDGVTASARGFVGVGYSYADYLEIAVHDLHIPLPGLRDLIADEGHMICSQLADAAADRAGWHLFSDGRWPGDVSPVELARLALAQVAAP